MTSLKQLSPETVAKAVKSIVMKTDYTFDHIITTCQNHFQGPLVYKVIEDSEDYFIVTIRDRSGFECAVGSRPQDKDHAFILGVEALIMAVLTKETDHSDKTVH